MHFGNKKNNLETSLISFKKKALILTNILIGKETIQEEKNKYNFHLLDIINSGNATS